MTTPARSGVQRVRAGLHYIAINLAAALLFLIGVAMIYGVTGTLNMAEYSSARRMISVFMTGWPSSVNPRAP